MAENVPAQDKAGPASPLGLYVHVPFCASTCEFCAFYQTQPTADGVERFLAGVGRELALAAPDRPVETVFWGGGTPGLLAPDDLRRLGETVLAHTLGRPREWTVELAPSSVTGARLRVLRELGVTRLSLGVQSFQPELLDALGRRHTRAQVDRAWERVRAAGFASVNLDLIFAIPGQTGVQWRADLEEAVRREPDHLSTYCLTFEEDTALWVKLAQGRVKLDVEKEARFYEETWAFLEAAGFGQYEISNFARPGHCCRHNLNTWRMHEWIGLGPSAASQYAGWRGANTANLDQWEREVGEGRRQVADRVRLTPELLAADMLIFGLRMNEGVSLAALRGRFPAVVGLFDSTVGRSLRDLRRCRTENGGLGENSLPQTANRISKSPTTFPAVPLNGLEKLWSRLAEEGLMEFAGEETVRLTRAGRLVADAIGVEIMTALDTPAGAVTA